MLEIRHDDPALGFSNVFFKLVYHFQITLAHRFCNDFAHRNYGVYGLKFYLELDDTEIMVIMVINFACNSTARIADTILRYYRQ